MPDILETAQKGLKSVLATADALEAKINGEGRMPNADETPLFAQYAEQASQFSKQIADLKSLKSAKVFGETPDVPFSSAFGGETFEGTNADKAGSMKGVGADRFTGEIYSLDKVADNLVKMLKSGDYKDAINDSWRSRALGRPMKAASMKVLAEVGFGSGEAWLPPDYRAELIKKIMTTTSVRQNARSYTTGTDIVTFPSVNYTTDDKYTSGVRFSWRGSSVQTSAITEATNPVAGQVKIPVNLATASIILQREQFEDNAFDIMGYVTELGGEAFALGEEDAFTTGDGNGKPLGFTKHPSAGIAVGTTTTTNGLAYQGRLIESGSTVTLDWGTISTGIIGTEASLPPQYEANAKWFANKKTYATIRSINAGTATLPQWSLGDSWPNYANGMKASLLGYPTVRNQFMTDVAQDAGVVAALSDMSGYYIMDRVGLSVEIDPSIYRLQDQVVVYMRKRTGGQLVHYWKTVFLAVKA